MREWPRASHYVVLAALVVLVFLLDLWTPLGIADWLLYVVPAGYALWHLRQGRITFSLLSLVAGGLTVLILLGWFLSPAGVDQQTALLNRIFGILTIWFMTLSIAWLSNKIWALREAKAIMQQRLDEKELRLKQALDAGGIASLEWDLRKGSVRWGGPHEFLTGQCLSSFDESYRDCLDRIHQEDRDSVRDAMDRAMRERSDFHVQCRIHVPSNQLQSVIMRGRFIYRGIEPIRMVGVCLDLTHRDSSMLEQSEQMVIDLEERFRNAASFETSWTKPRQWAQHVMRLGIERIRVLPKKPDTIS